MIYDIFEYIREHIECDYVSDMKSGQCRSLAIKTLCSVNKNLINPVQYNDICTYLGI